MGPCNIALAADVHLNFESGEGRGCAFSYDSVIFRSKQKGSGG